MDWKRSFRWAGAYFAWTSLFALIGLVLVAVGVVMGGRGAYADFQQNVATATILRHAAPGLALAFVGFLVYRFGKAWALYRTLTAAGKEDLSDTFDTQHVKSDIVSVLDDRLSDMQQDLQSVNRELRELKREDAEAPEERF